MDNKSKTYIDTYIDTGQQEVLSLKNLYDTILTTDIDDVTHIIRIPIQDFFVKYRAQLNYCVKFYTVPDIYFYKPKSLSLDLYNTTEMWLSILRINNMRNITEFHQPVIKVYNPADVKELINIIFKRENKLV